MPLRSLRTTLRKGGTLSTVPAKIVGIDLGTTNSLVAYMDGPQPKVITNQEGRTLVPSVVSFSADGILVGDPAKARMITHPHQTVYSIKRLMGKGMEDLKG